MIFCKEKVNPSELLNFVTPLDSSSILHLVKALLNNIKVRTSIRSLVILVPSLRVLEHFTADALSFKFVDLCNFKGHTLEFSGCDLDKSFIASQINTLKTPTFNTLVPLLWNIGSKCCLFSDETPAYRILEGLFPFAVDLAELRMTTDKV
ncbi:hypothetical protein PanWU01x14_302740 [Parasponia andersonii]|uniref:Uncharacterized protein n=1 Tax=Parasponia andersonii TaxID=3476 RepID=A0A2P5AT99_PARAD|nr:hypothetical protein PanWU01x14_302740 [Parasponia andersonii]